MLENLTSASSLIILQVDSSAYSNFQVISHPKTVSLIKRISLCYGEDENFAHKRSIA